ncbi:glycosyltransferase family 4 protein [Desulfosoma sp.]
MRILHVETGRHLYGGAYQVLRLLKGLSALGVENILCAPKDSAIAREAAPYATLNMLSLSGELDPRLPMGLWRAVRRWKPHLLHVHSRRGADWWGGVVAARTQTPAVVTRRVDNPEHPLAARLKYGLYRRVIGISSAIVRVLQSEGIRAEKIRCVPSCIEPDRFQAPYDKRDLLRELGLPEGSRLIGTVAQLIARKGHERLIAVAPAICARHPDVYFCFFGRGPLRDRLQQIAEARKISQRIHFAGFRSDMDRIFPCLDLLVHPATLEGLGVCLLEAAAAGVPIVASKAGGIPEVVRHGLNGLLVDPHSPAELQSAVLWMLNHPEEARLMGAQGADLVRAHFSPQAMVQGNLRVYEEILGGS